MEKYFSFKTKAISKSRNSSLLLLDDVLKQEYVYSSLQEGCTHTHTHTHARTHTHTHTHTKKHRHTSARDNPDGIFGSFKVTFPM